MTIVFAVVNLSFVLFITACECNNNSESCSYNETKGYGDCNDFKDNNVTLGERCDLCKESFYRKAALPQNSSNICLGKIIVLTKRTL